MPQGGFQSEKDFQDFQALNPMQQLKYLHATDPDFGKLSVEQKEQYVDHILGKEPPKEQSFGDRLTAGGSSPEAQKGDEWLSKHIPIAGPALGKGLRYLDAAGGTVMGIPGSIYHSFADPLTPEEQARGQNRYEAVPERLLGAEQTASALHDYGAGKVSPRAALSVLPEALGTGTGIAGATEGLGLAKKGFGSISEPGRNALAQRMRYPATESQAAIGKPGSVRPLPFTPDWLSEGLVPKGRPGSPTNPGTMVGLPRIVPKGVLAEEQAGPLGSSNNPGPMSKLPTRVPASVLREEQAARTPPEQSVPVERDATLNKRNIPEYAGEEESPVTSPSRISAYGRPGGRMNRPFLPVIATPEDMQVFQNQMGILKPEAQAAGMYSAARGAVRSMPDYQMRIGGKLRPFGPPEDLMEDSTPPVRRKVENE